MSQDIAYQLRILEKSRKTAFGVITSLAELEDIDGLLKLKKLLDEEINKRQSAVIAVK